MGMLLAALLSPLTLQWPTFRGPERNGHAPHVELPDAFDPERDRIWTLELDPGTSSPILVGKQLLLTVRRGGGAGGHGDGSTDLACVDAERGRLLWEIAGPAFDAAPAFEDGLDPALHAASTPVSDGAGVFVSYPEFGLVGYELSGQERWRRQLTPYRARYPGASSLALAQGRLVYLCDQDADSYIVALSPEDGSTLWRVERPHATHGFSSPTILGETVIVSGPHRVDAYDLETGELRWSTSGMSWQPRATPIGIEGNVEGASEVPRHHKGGVVYVQSAVQSAQRNAERRQPQSWDEALAAWDADGDGRLSRSEAEGADIPGEWSLHDLDRSGALDASEWAQLAARSRSGSGLWALALTGYGNYDAGDILWRRSRRIPLTATPILMDNTLVLVRDGGIAMGLDATHGTESWHGRLEGLSGKIYSSPISLGSDVLVFSSDGSFASFDPQTGTVGASGALSDGVWATPAVGEDALFVRTNSALHAFALEPVSTLPESDPQAPALAFVGVDVLTMTASGLLRDQTLEVRRGRITRLGPRDSTPLSEKAEVLARGPGLTVTPGLIDSWTRVEDEHELLLHLRAGVTTIRSVDGRPSLLELRARVEDGDIPGPRWVLGGPLAGRGHAPDQFLAALEEGARAGYDFATVVRGAPLQNWRRIAQRASALGIPLAGPLPAELPLKAAFGWPLLSIDHLETLVAQPGLAAALARTQVPLAPLTAAHATAIQVTTERQNWMRDSDALRDVSPLVRELWGPAAHALHPPDSRSDEEQQQSLEDQREALKALHQAGARLLAGSNAMTSFVLPGKGLLDELHAFVAAGLSPESALRTATLNPASMLEPFVGEPIGSIAVGGLADLVLVSGSPSEGLDSFDAPLGTMVRGDWFPAEKLEEALNEAREVYEREAEFVRAIAKRRNPARAKKELAATLATDEMRTFEVRQSTVRRLIELLSHPAVRRTAEAGVLTEYAQMRWPSPTPGSGGR